MSILLKTALKLVDRIYPIELVRQTFYNANSLSNLFTNVAGDTNLQFLKEINPLL
jgi:hypothetical protein